jgi:uncharacterized Zn-binding protein involved in type VI secretion
MPQPVAIVQGIAFAFPDVCNTPAPPGPPVPIPYPNIAQLADATPNSSSGGAQVFANGKAIVLGNSEVPTSSGDEAGSASPTKGKCTFTTKSSTVLINGQGVVRFGDTTSQNGGNAVGSVLSAPSTVLAGG